MERANAWAPRPRSGLALGLGLTGALLLAGSRRLPEHPINLNTATVTELMQLPRVGPRTAERIVAFRREHGPFQRPEEIMNVRGLGEKAFRRLKPFLAVEPAAASAMEAARR